VGTGEFQQSRTATGSSILHGLVAGARAYPWQRHSVRYRWLFGMAAPWQGLPVRLERAPHRGAAFALSNASKRARIRSIGSRSRGSLLIFDHPPAVAPPGPLLLGSASASTARRSVSHPAKCRRRFRRIAYQFRRHRIGYRFRRRLEVYRPLGDLPRAPGSVQKMVSRQTVYRFLYLRRLRQRDLVGSNETALGVPHQNDHSDKDQVERLHEACAGGDHLR
jgi:hypothetical protein